MLLQGISQIVKSDQRECHQWSGYKSFSSCFRRGLWEADLYDASSQVIIRDEFLDAGQTFVELNKSGESTWLIPLVGAIAVKCAESKEEVFVSSEQILCLPANSKHSYTIHNPFDLERINFLRITGIPDSDVTSGIQEFELIEKNTFVPLVDMKVPSGSAYACIGVFSGRHEAVYHVRDTANEVYAYVINGAFDMEGRLLEHRDALMISELPGIEFEALSEHAILLIMEFSH